MVLGAHRLREFAEVMQRIAPMVDGTVPPAQITSVPDAGTTLHLIFPDESGQANLTKP
jgi:hypothetical protein